MYKIIGKLQQGVIRKTAGRCRERGIVIPTFGQLRDPSLVPQSVRRRLRRAE